MRTSSMRADREVCIARVSGFRDFTDAPGSYLPQRKPTIGTIVAPGNRLPGATIAALLPYCDGRSSRRPTSLDHTQVVQDTGVSVAGMDTVRVDAADLKVELDEFGFVVLHNLVPADKAARMAGRLMGIMRQQQDSARPDQGLRGVFNHLKLDEYDLFLPLVTNPVFLDLARHVLGDGFQMAEVGCRWIKPGGPPQHLHADVPIGWFADNGLAIPQTCFMLNCMWMLTEFTRANGGTLIMPFSHHSGRVPRAGVAYRHLVPAEGPPGSIVIFRGNVWHGSGANITTDSHRVGVSSGYHAQWMDPAAGGWHLMKRAVRDQMPPRVQAMSRHVAPD